MLGLWLLLASPAGAQIPTPPPPLPTPTPQPSPSPTPNAAAILEQFLAELANPADQGILIVDAAGNTLAAHQPQQLFPAASVTKLAPTQVAITKWGLDHRFSTAFYTTGTWGDDGRLVGDLWLVGGGDPYFVSEDAAALRTAFADLGIWELSGSLHVVGDFSMNFEPDPLAAGALFLEALGWQAPIQAATALPANATLIQQHSSLDLQTILLAFNTFSNNIMAEILAQQLGGVAYLEAQMQQLSGSAVQMENASGLGYANQFSPAAVIAILQDLRDREPLANLFPSLTTTSRTDVTQRAEAHLSAGTLAGRNLPLGTTAKTGTLNGVVSLAGELPDGRLFVLLNQGWDMTALRDWQDRLLQALMPQ